MRLYRLRAVSFAAIRDVDIEFGPGLNVLYAPNDLGKSTLVAAIRLALLLPHSSTHCDQYIGWNGGDDPIVEMTFETEAQRIWRVRKQFGKGARRCCRNRRTVRTSMMWIAGGRWTRSSGRSCVGAFPSPAEPAAEKAFRRASSRPCSCRLGLAGRTSPLWVTVMARNFP